MSGWNYRIIKRDFVLPNGKIESRFAVHEVYYSEHTGAPRAVTKDPCWPRGETLEELKKDLEHYLKAFDKKVLDWKLFGGKEDERESLSD